MINNKMCTVLIINELWFIKFFLCFNSKVFKRLPKKLLVVRINHKKSNHFCYYYRAVYDTPSIQEDSLQKMQTLKSVALFIVLSPFDNEQSDLIHHILKEKHFKEIPKYKSLLEQFINQVR